LDLSSLGDNETIARLANGIQRFLLPSDYNFIRQLNLLAEQSNGNGAYKEQALVRLATIYENRRQWPKAAEYWRHVIANSSIANSSNGRDYQERLDQIVGAWAQFEPLPVQAQNDTNKIVNLRFRNGASVQISAYRLQTADYLRDLKAHLNSNPQQLNWDRVNLPGIGYQVLQANNQYRGERLRTWTQQLTPAPNHEDKHQAIHLPTDLHGTYLLEATVAGGNTTFIVVWNTDAIIVKKPMADGEFYYVADAVTGAPLGNQALHFFGYRTEWKDLNVAQRVFTPNAREFDVTTEEFAVVTADNGQVIVNQQQLSTDYQWLVHTDADEDDFAFLGFQSIWFGNRDYWRDQQTKSFIVSNQPVYPPGQTVDINAWLQTASYTSMDNPHANRQLQLRIHNPQGKVIVDQTIVSDKYGGITHNLSLPETADLGVYGIDIVGYDGYGQFRVEEYKKPEFEVVIDKPQGVAKLGDTLHTTIKANY